MMKSSNVHIDAKALEKSNKSGKDRPVFGLSDLNGTTGISLALCLMFLQKG
jgi:hypothetical protein